MVSDDLKGFLNAAALGDNILDDQHPLIRGDLETTSEDQFSLLLLREDEAATQLPGDLLSDDQAAHGGGDHRLYPEVRSFRRDRGAEFLDHRHLLERLCALKELAGMQSAAKDEVTFEEGSGLAEEIECFCVRHSFSVRLFLRLDQSESQWCSFRGTF